MSDKNLPGKLSEDILKVNYLSTTTGEKLRPFQERFICFIRRSMARCT